jgi:hypothetical protein
VVVPHNSNNDGDYNEENAPKSSLDYALEIADDKLVNDEIDVAI